MGHKNSLNKFLKALREAERVLQEAVDFHYQKKAEGTMEATHEQLKSVCIGFKDYLKKTKHVSGLNDCSCGCKYYHVLSGKAGQDWGICWNKKSPRAGKLTFEHMERCRLFKREA